MRSSVDSVLIRPALVSVNNLRLGRQRLDTPMAYQPLTLEEMAEATGQEFEQLARDVRASQKIAESEGSDSENAVADD